MARSPHGRAHLPAALARAPRMDHRHHPRLHVLVAGRFGLSVFHTREQTNGLLESRLAGPTGSLAEQDGTDAVEDGADEEPHGAPRLRLWPAVQRQSRLR